MWAGTVKNTESVSCEQFSSYRQQGCFHIRAVWPASVAYDCPFLLWNTRLLPHAAPSHTSFIVYSEPSFASALRPCGRDQSVDIMLIQYEQWVTGRRKRGLTACVHACVCMHWAYICQSVITVLGVYETASVSTLFMSLRPQSERPFSY